MRTFLLIVAVTTVVWGCTKPHNPVDPPPVNGNADSITSFVLAGTFPATKGIIKRDTIFLTIPPGADPTALAPDIQLSGSSATVYPGSGTVSNFTKSVMYTVTSAARYTRRYYTRFVKDVASAKDEPKAPAALCIYYAWPSVVNGAGGDVEAAATSFAKFDVLVLGDGIWQSAHGDNAKTKQIIARLRTKKPGMKIFGYIDVGKTQNLSVAQMQEAILGWQNMGADGVFGDEFGYDFAVDRVRQNSFVDFAHARGMKVFVNSWRVEDALGDYDGASTHLQEGDYYLLESLLVGKGNYTSLEEYKYRADRAYYYMKTKKISVAAVSTIFPSTIDATTNNTSVYSYTWCGAAMYNFDAFQLTDSSYSVQNTSAFYYPPMSTSYGMSWEDADWTKVVSEAQCSRSTNSHTISLSRLGTYQGTGRIDPK